MYWVVGIIALFVAAGFVVPRLMEGGGTSGPALGRPAGGQTRLKGLTLDGLSQKDLKRWWEGDRDPYVRTRWLAEAQLRIPELDNYLAAFKTEYTRIRDERGATTFEEKGKAANKVRLSDVGKQPNGIALGQWKGELAPALEATPEPNRIWPPHPILTPGFIQRFGGDDFLFNFRMYADRVRKAGGAVALHVPKDDHYRKRFDALAKGGMARTGEAVPLVDKLQCLKAGDMRTWVDDLGAQPANRQRKADMAAALAETPGAADRMSQTYPDRDWFYLPEPDFDIAQIEGEWAIYDLYQHVIHMILAEGDHF